MAYPAPAPADGPDGSARPGKPDPLSPGWADVRAGIITEAAAMRLALEELTLAVRELRHTPDGDRRLDAALETARLNLAIAERFEALGRRCVLDESVMEARERAAYEQGAADARAARCHLEAVPDPR